MNMGAKKPEEWLSTDDIPEDLRQGRYDEGYRNNWDFSDIERYRDYLPTPKETAIIKANFTALKERTRQAYLGVPEATKPAIEQVLYNALDKINYSDDTFKKYDFTGMTSERPMGILNETYEQDVEKPKGPGEVMAVNTRAIKGGSVRPNSVEAIKRKAIVDGLDMMFPETALKEHMKHFLSMPLMDRNYKFVKAHDLGVGDLSAKMEDFIKRIVRHGDNDNNSGFPVRKDFDDARKMLERNNTKMPDNFHDRNVAAIGEFIRKKPEYVLALFMWTQALTDYCRDLKSYVRTEMGSNLQEIMKEAPFWDTVALIEGGNHEAKHFDLNAERQTPNIDQANKMLPVTGPNSFFYASPIVSAVVGALLEQSAITHKNAGKQDMDPASYKAAFNNLSDSGIFQQEHVGKDNQPIVIRCPMSKKLGEWLTIDLGEEGRPEDQVLVRLVQKVREDLASPEWNLTKKMEGEVQYFMKENLDLNKSRQIQQALDTRDKDKCPFHYKNG